MKNKIEHTPGPWWAEIPKEGFYQGWGLIFSKGKAKKDRTEYRPAPIVTYLMPCCGNMEDAANAQLIAAAPELLAALDKAADLLYASADKDREPGSYGRDCYDAMEAARAAIAKAKGEK